MDEMTRIHTRERRKDTRYPVCWRVDLGNGGGQTRDISASGVCIETEIDVPYGNIRFLLFPTEHIHKSYRLECEGKVVRIAVGSQASTVGVRFLNFRFGQNAPDS